MSIALTFPMKLLMVAPALALNRWDDELGFGIFVLTPLVGWLICMAGWRFGYLIFGLGLLALLAPISLFVFRDSPRAMGLQVDGAAPPTPFPDKSSAPLAPGLVDWHSTKWEVTAWCSMVALGDLYFRHCS